MSPKDKGSVRVYCRVRPLMKNEEIRCVQVKKNEIIFNRQNSEEDCPTNSMGTQEEHLNFSFDNVFDENASQAEIFDGVRGKEVVRDVLSGYNGTLFAYGQTNAGKTHTIQGGSNSIEDDQNDGIIGRAGKALFQGVRDAKESIEFAIKVSFVEIYQERIRDLLNKYSSFGTNNGDRQSGEKQGLQIREDKQRGIYIKGCTEIFITNYQELMKTIELGIKNRKVAATGMNAGSSRSHSVLTITVTQQEDPESIKEGKLVLVDLAGSEMVKKSLATGVQLEEAKNINKSLSALASVIFALTEEKTIYSGTNKIEKKKRVHIPYRDSKLTRMLQDSLGGNAKTGLILCISAARFNAQETLSTLRFGTRAKRIKNTPKINEQKSIAQLQALLAKAEAAIDLQASYITALEKKVAQSKSPQKQLVSNNNITYNQEDQQEAPENNNQEEEDTDDFATLRTQLAALNEELEDERNESQRQSTEVKRLTRLLEEKDQQLIKATDLLEEARTALNQSVKETNQAISERDQALTLAESRSFDLEERDLEIQQLKNILKTKEEQEQEQQKMFISTSSSTINNKEQDDQIHEDFFDHDPANNRIPSSTNDQDTTPQNYLSYLKTWKSKQEEHEQQRNRLITDLEKCQQRLRIYEEKDNHLSTSTTEEQQLATRHARSLQQRMQQLVAIHRQLLRKYAALEINLAQANKKIQLRDERIHRLEESRSRLSQLDKYKSEISSLDVKLNNLIKLHKESFSSPSLPGGTNLRGATGGLSSLALRTLRGGASNYSSDIKEEAPISTPQSSASSLSEQKQKLQQQSFFSRLRG